MPFPSVTYTFSNATTADGTQVNQNFTDLINGISDTTKNISVSAGTFAGALTAQANVTLGNSSSNLLVVNASLNSTIPINTTTSYDIGSTTIGLRAVYFGDGGSAARCTKIIGATIAAGYTLTLPIAVPAGNSYAIESTTGGVLSFNNRRIIPTVQVFTSGTGNYTPAAGVLYCIIEGVGGGGGGGPSGSSTGTGAGNGGNTTFGTTALVGNGGAGGTASQASPSAGGTASLGSGQVGVAVAGAQGSAGMTIATSLNEFTSGGSGGSTPFGGGGGGAGGTPTAGGAAATNSGGGGGGASGPGLVSASYGGAGGGAGGWFRGYMTAASATTAYAIGASGTAGGAGAGGAAGGAGAAGYIIVTEYYQ